MIIDFHTHTFPEKISAETVEKLSLTSKSKAFSDGTLQGLLKNMKKSLINFSIILPVATNVNQVEKINNISAKINEKFFSEGIISFASMHPEFENFREELKRIKNLGFKGIKIHPFYQKTNLDDEKYLRILYKAAELDLIVVTHAGLDIGFVNEKKSTPQMIKKILEKISEIKIVLAHMAGWKNWDEILSELAGKKFYMDTAFSTGKITPRKNFEWDEEELKLLDEKKFVEFVKVFGAEKILFGTDSPWTSAEESINFIKKIPISEDEKNKIFYENAKKLLKL